MSARRVRIIGIDPGLRRTGWGIIDHIGSRLSHVANGTVASQSDAGLSTRLVQLHDGLVDVLHHWHPDEAAIEETFVNRDARSALKLGHARGIALMAPARAQLPVSEYAPNTIKKSVVGAGHAQKEQIAAMIKILLPCCQPDSADAADALAVAICHAHHRSTPADAKCS